MRDDPNTAGPHKDAIKLNADAKPGIRARFVSQSGDQRTTGKACPAWQIAA